MPKFNAAAVSRIVLIAALVLSSCSSSTPVVPSPTSTPTTASATRPATTSPSPAPSATPTPPSPTAGTTLANRSAESSPDALGHALWAWSGTYTGDRRLVKVLDPLRYTLEFLEDGQLRILADCNLVKGNYQLPAAGQIDLQVVISSRLACPADSQAVEFLAELDQVQASQLADGTLQLRWQDGAHEMRFSPYNPMDPPAPAEGAPTAIAHANVAVRLGPDAFYPAYGYLRAGARAEIVGKYTPWWAVRLPGHPDSIGWVSQQQVKTENAGDVPSLPPPADDFGRTFPFPGFDDPQLLVTDPTLILTGPGENYPAVLAGLAAANLFVLGISEDGQYYQVYLPPEIVPAGNGWIPVGSVRASNVTGAPTVKAPQMPAAGMYPAPGSPLAAALTTLNYRSGPSLDYDVLDFALKGELMPILGGTEDGTWLQVQVPSSVSSSLKAWVAAPNVYVFNPDQVGLAATPLPAWVPTSVTESTCRIGALSPRPGQAFVADQDFTVEVELYNDSDHSWGRDNVDVVFVAAFEDQDLHTGPDVFDLSASVPSGQSYRLSFPANSSRSSGDLGEVWAVMEGSQTICSFSFRINVQATPLPPTATPWPTQTGTIEPTPLPSATPTPVTPTATPPPEYTATSEP